MFSGSINDSSSKLLSLKLLRAAATSKSRRSNELIYNAGPCIQMFTRYEHLWTLGLIDLNRVDLGVISLQLWVSAAYLGRRWKVQLYHNLTVISHHGGFPY